MPEVVSEMQNKCIRHIVITNAKENLKQGNKLLHFNLLSDLIIFSTWLDNFEKGVTRGSFCVHSAPCCAFFQIFFPDLFPSSRVFHLFRFSKKTCANFE